MLTALIELGLFTAKTIIIFLFIVLVLIAILGILAKAKEKMKNRLCIRNLNKKYAEVSEELLAETLSKKQFKQFKKDQKAKEKAEEKSAPEKKNIYVLSFHGDMKASSVDALREEITAVLNIAKPRDEVIVRLDSAGGIVHCYGLAAAQLMRIRAKAIPLTIAIDKIAASGGYMMACIANKIICAPFAIIGSIGVIVQLPNFHRLLKDKHIEFEQLTAGEYKRTITLFGENTEAGREKLREEIETVHTLFKNLIAENRRSVNIAEVATGEYWYGSKALELKLVDDIKTSDDLLLECSQSANLYEIHYETKKPLLSKLSAAANAVKEKCLRMIAR